MRIISVVPSITELLFDLGLKNQIIGRTKFCIHPSSQVKEIQQFGGTKNLHIDKIIAAKPDLIIANKEENLKDEITSLQSKFEVLTTNVSDLQDNNQMIKTIGELTDTTSRANQLVNKINTEFNQLTHLSKMGSALYLIWKEPMMSIGNDTFIHNMLQYAGFENVLQNQKRYPVIDSFKTIQPDYVFLSSEPYPFQQKDIYKIQSIFPKSKVILVDGEMFSWYGSRMQYAPKYFLRLRKRISNNYF